MFALQGGDDGDTEFFSFEPSSQKNVSIVSRSIPGILQWYNVLQVLYSVELLRKNLFISWPNHDTLPASLETYNHNDVIFLVGSVLSAKHKRMSLHVLHVLQHVKCFYPWQESGNNCPYIYLLESRYKLIQV